MLIIVPRRGLLLGCLNLFSRIKAGKVLILFIIEKEVIKLDFDEDIKDSLQLLRGIDEKFKSPGLGSELFNDTHTKLFPDSPFELNSLSHEYLAVIKHLSQVAQACSTKGEFISRARGF